MQEGRPIAFHSQALKGRSLALSAYVRELLALVTTMHKWRPYLVGKPFLVKTDQQSLKYILKQKIGTPAQQKWITKLLGYAFIVEYKKGKENVVADALSRQVNGGGASSQEGILCMISFPTPNWLAQLKASYVNDHSIMSILVAFQAGTEGPKGFNMQNGLLLYKGRMYLGTCDSLETTILQQVHDGPLGGHSGFLKTLHRVQRDFYQPRLRADVRKYVKECDTCQRLKHETCNATGLLQPLPILVKPWVAVSMDFVEGFPKSQMKEVVMVVVDRLTKFVYFVALSHPYTASKVAVLYMQHVFKLHGMSTSIVIGRDPIFTSNFQQELRKLQGIQLAMSLGYHHQIDGQTKVVNKSLEHYLRAFTADKPAIWVEWLPFVELQYNTNFHNSLKLTPFEALYGYPPPRFIDYIPRTTKVEGVDAHLKSRQQLTSLLRQNLVVAQERMKMYSDRHRTERSFVVRDWVFL